MAYTWVSGGTKFQPMQMSVRYTKNDIDFFVDVNDLASGPAVLADFTILPAGFEGMVPDIMARCLCVTMVNDAAGTARGITVRIRGVNQFGQGVEETVAFAAKAAATTNITFTRNAYRIVSQITYMSRTGGAVQTNDRFDVGLAVLAATATGTHDATNGSGATDYKAFGVVTPLAWYAGVGTAVAADFPIQIHGHVLTEDGTSGVQTWAEISRANDFNFSPTYSVLTPDEEFVAALGAGASAIEMDLNILIGFYYDPANPVEFLASQVPVVPAEIA